MLKRNISFEELTQKDEEIEQYPTIQEELKLISNEGARQNSTNVVTVSHTT